MKSISIDNKKYVKATDIARELGYTADYVGQLCRKKKVDAELVGRSWYVSETSIRNHKKNRYRSTAKINKQHISTTIQAAEADSLDSYPVQIHTNKGEETHAVKRANFYDRADPIVHTIYTPDESDLIPLASNKKTGTLQVQLGDSQPVPIKTQSDQSHFAAESRKQIQFKGAVPVRAVYQDDVLDMETSSKVQKTSTMKQSHGVKNITEQSHLGVKTSKIKVKHIRKERKNTNKLHAPMESNTSGVIGMTAVGPLVEGGTLAIPSLSGDVPPTSKYKYGYIIYITILLSFLIAFFMIGMQVSVVSDDSSSLFSYNFSFENILTSFASFR